MKNLSIAFAVLFIFAAVVPVAQANVKQLKVYREVYPDYKPKCNYCHVDEKPKKDDGKHDLNAYGQKLQELMNGEALTEEIIREVGSHEDFEAAAEAGEDMSSLTPAEDVGNTTAETARLVEETRGLVEETKDMVSQTQEMVTETAAATEEVKTMLADKTPEYALNASQEASGE
ncbi:MAG: hypothetical protein KC897_01710 [Candidatus Omnitrophica bacterium]|nr:hypothetical protein [Candidatus Omnitrophota bacterium]MCB9721965.1 hypothetical protein [Candidatus Omnitrophota bacterium]